MNIYLLRHGETDWNLEGRLQGHQDIVMNANGIAQIERTASALAELNIDVDVIMSSPLKRAQRSAQMVADRLGYEKENIMTEPLFTERGFGEAEGLIYAEVKDQLFAGEFRNVESIETLCERGGEAFRKTVRKYEEQNVLIASHGAILKALIVSITDGIIAYESGKVTFHPGSIYLVKYEGNILEIFRLEADKKDFYKVDF